MHMNVRPRNALKILCVATVEVFCVWGITSAEQDNPASQPAAEAAPANTPRKSLLDDVNDIPAAEGTVQNREDLTQLEMERRRIRGEVMRQEVARRIENVDTIV